ncbi:DUF6245 family protein [Kitasatospora sp. NBC_00458]|uniref:DUF6245 family protein n=1 Tax=Kitasatospora sp. NBC_00458 TaxID=2903568 RepID=UPI002E18B12A
MTINHIPVTVQQIGAALAALGRYEGNNTAAEHADYAAQFSHPDIYRVRLINALLGFVQKEAMLADEVEPDAENPMAALGEQLKSADAWELSPQVDFIRWQVERASIPLQLIASDRNSGPLPVAAVYAAEAMHILLGRFDTPEAAVDLDALAGHVAEVRRARELLRVAIENTDILLNALDPNGE